MKERFTTHEVARILDLPEARLRSCLRAAFPSSGKPARPLEFTFQDLLLLKTTKGLLDARVSVSRIRRILISLKRQLPEDPQLGSVTIYADGRRVVVWDGTVRWHPDSGQFLFDFEPRQMAKHIALKNPARKSPPSGLTAEQWFDLASELEKNSPEEACQAYHQALQLDSSLVAAHINLGRLHHSSGRLEEAEACYRVALHYDPDEILAHFNLGVLLEDKAQPAAAIAAYREALVRDASMVDAHYNLALLYEAQGRRSEAIRHLRSAQKLGQCRKSQSPTKRTSPPRRPSPFRLA